MNSRVEDMSVDVLPAIPRSFILWLYHSLTDMFSVGQDYKFRYGEALSQGPDGLVRPLYVDGIATFAGFADTTFDNNRVGARVKGIVTLSIPGAMPSNFGKTVFATAPNEFNMENGIQIGRLVHWRDSGKSDVLFVKGGSIEPADWQGAVSLYCMY